MICNFTLRQTFCGGILADAMGLEKTLGMIALITSDLHCDDGGSGLYCDGVESPRNHQSIVKTTLLIVK